MFTVLFLLGIVFLIVKRFVNNPVTRKLLTKLVAKDLTMGLVGLFWAGMRYENTPIFAKRFWVGLILAVFVLWFGYILKYMFFGFRREKKEYADLQMRNKYMPGKK